MLIKGEGWVVKESVTRPLTIVHVHHEMFKHCKVLTRITQDCLQCALVCDIGASEAAFVAVYGLCMVCCDLVVPRNPGKGDFASLRARGLCM